MSVRRLFVGRHYCPWVMSEGGDNLPFRSGSPEQIYPAVRSLRAAAHNKVEMSILRDETLKYCHEFFMWSNISKVSLKRKLVLRADIPEQYIPKRYLCYSEIVLYFTSHWQILMAIFSNVLKTFFKNKIKTDNLSKFENTTRSVTIKLSLSNQFHVYL